VTIQQWLFSAKGRLGRRDFWLWLALWAAAICLLFTLAESVVTLQTAAFMLVCLLWPTATVVIKRLHDRNLSGAWALLLIAAWMLVVGDWRVAGATGVWVLGRILPALIWMWALLELGVRAGTPGLNRYGKKRQMIWRGDYQ